MNFDTFSIAAMATELRQTLLGGRVQRVTQINSLTYSFEIYVYPTRHYLIVSAEPQAPRLHLTLDKSRRGVGHDTPLMLVLRKYMRGAKLGRIEQPPYERILNLHFDSPFEPTILAIELLGTRSNLILVGSDQAVLGVARLPKANRRNRRVLLPGHLYEPPPPQQKRLPAQLTEETLRQELAEASPRMKLTRLLPQVVVGVSPLLAREISYRATGRSNSRVEQIETPAAVTAAFNELFTQFHQEAWQPSLAYDPDDGLPAAFAPYPLTHLLNPQPVDSFSEAVEIYYADSAADYGVAKAPLFESIAAARQKLARRRQRMEEDAAGRANADQLRQFGEAILAGSYQINPGQTELQVEWLPDEIIKLDPTLSASENAQQYFNRYRKSQRTAAEIPVQLKKIKLEEQHLEQLEQDLEMAENRPEIDAVAGQLAEAGYSRSRRGRRKKRQKRAVSNYLRLKAPKGASVWVGKNSLQNAHLTFNRAGSDDLWLHARGVPGAHVIIPTAQGLPSEEDVLWAAAVAAYYSKARHDTAVDVDVTVKKYVRAIKGAAPGMVTYRNESTLRVEPHRSGG